MYLDREEICNLFQSGTSLADIQIADKSTRSMEEIVGLLMEEGVWTQAREWDRGQTFSNGRAGICNKYLEGESIAQIARNYRTSTATVRKILKEESIYKAPTMEIVDSKDELSVCAQYRQGKTLRELSILYYCSAPTISRVLIKNGVEHRKRGRPPEHMISEQFLKESYESGVCVAELAKEYGVTDSVIRGALRRCGTVMRKAGTRGVFSNRFKPQ